MISTKVNSKLISYPPPLRPPQALSGAAGFEAIGGDVPHALQRRGLRALDRCFDVTDRAYYWQRSDRAGVTDSFYLLLAPELVTFAYNTRWAAGGEKLVCSYICLI